MKMVNGGVTIEVVNASDIPHYLKAGYVREVEQPVERRAAVTPPDTEELVKPKTAKARKKEINGNN